MATHSNILARRIPEMEEPGKLQSMGSQESDMTQQLNHYITGLLCKILLGGRKILLLRNSYSNAFCVLHLMDC